MNASNVTAQEFAETMFQDMPVGAHTKVIAFACEPSDESTVAAQKKWSGADWWPPEMLPTSYCWKENDQWQRRHCLVEKGNAYICISAFRLDPQTGRRNRKAANHVQSCAVMIDDVGTKVPFERSKLPPTARIETSPGNFQDWLFLRPNSSSRSAEAMRLLIHRMIEQGLTSDGADPGMAGVARVGRLPCGINNKPKYVAALGKPFAVRCVEWTPERRYYFEDIIATWDLDMRPDEHRRAVVPISSAAATEALHRFAALLRVFELLGWHQHRVGEWHHVRCPWVEWHTDRDETGAALSAPSESNNWRGGFKCHHGHCAEMTIRDVWRFVDALDRRRRQGRL